MAICQTDEDQSLYPAEFSKRGKSCRQSKFKAPPAGDGDRGSGMRPVQHTSHTLASSQRRNWCAVMLLQLLDVHALSAVVIPI